MPAKESKPEDKNHGAAIAIIIAILIAIGLIGLGYAIYNEENINNKKNDSSEPGVEQTEAVGPVTEDELEDEIEDIEKLEEELDNEADFNTDDLSDENLKLDDSN